MISAAADVKEKRLTTHMYTTGEYRINDALSYTEKVNKWSLK